MRLALHLGKTRKQLLSEMDSEELSLWMAFDRVEPLPDSYWQAGLVASTFVNVMGSGKKRFKPEEFVPSRRVKKQTDEEMAAIFMGIAEAHNAMQERREPI